MSNVNKNVEDFKTEIRSLLISAPEGIPLRRINKDYSEMIGRNIPFRELGYPSLEDFLCSFPDAIRIARNRNNELYLHPVADESTSHIVEMVNKQRKPTSRNRGRQNQRLNREPIHPSYFHNYGNNYYNPPRMSNQGRFNNPTRMIHHDVGVNRKNMVPLNVKGNIKNILLNYPNGMQLNNLLPAYNKHLGVDLNIHNYGCANLENFVKGLEKENVLSVVHVQNNIKIFSAKADRPAQPLISAAPVRMLDQRHSALPSVTQRMSENRPFYPEVSTAPSNMIQQQRHTTQPSVTQRLSENQSIYPEVSTAPMKMMQKQNYTQVADNQRTKFENESTKCQTTDPNSGTQYSTKGNWEETCPVNEKVLKNLQKVMDRYSGGFPITQLSDKYEAVTGQQLLPSGLGFHNIQDLVNELSDIFHIDIQADGEWKLVDARFCLPAQSPTSLSIAGTPQPLHSQQQIEIVKKNIHELLSLMSDGILLNEFEQEYQVNFNERLPWKALNYKCLEDFIINLSMYPPIRLVPNGLNQAKVVITPKEDLLNYLKPLPNIATQETVTPPDAVLPGQSYTQLQVPEDQNDYFTMGIATVDNPGKLWIHIYTGPYPEKPDYRNQDLDNLMDELEFFYTSTEAVNYGMPDVFLIEGMVCAVLFPEDQNWHRGCIKGKPGPSMLEIFYIDYGTVCKVEKSDLRLLKKEFLDLPAQAIRARLANIKPSTGGIHYDPRATNSLLDVCSDKPLMALVKSRVIKNTLTLLICDTSGEEDLFLSDYLVDEGYAVRCEDNEQLRLPHTSPSSLQASNIQQTATILLPGNIHGAATIQQPPGYNITDIQDSIANVSLEQSPHLDFNRESISPAAVNGIRPTLSRSLNLSDIPRGLDVGAVQSLLAKQGASVIDNSYKEVKVSPYQPPNLNADTKISLDAVKKLAARKTLTPKAEVGPFTKLDVSPDTRVRLQEQPQEQIQASPSFALLGRLHNQGSTESLYSSSSEENRTNEASSGSSNQKRFSKRIKFTDAYSAHLINYRRQPFLTSADLSGFIFGVDIIKRMLVLNKRPACHVIVSNEDSPELFEDLKRCKVSGFTKDDPEIKKVVLYLLSDVTEIMDFFGKPETLIDKVRKLMESFDPEDPFWLTPADAELDDNDNRKDLEEKLDSLTQERKILLHDMIESDSSNSRQAKELIRLEKEIAILKRRLSNFVDQVETKSAAELAQAFLDKLHSNAAADNTTTKDTSRSTVSPMEIVTVAPSTSSTITSHSIIPMAPPAGPASGLYFLGQPGLHHPGVRPLPTMNPQMGHQPPSYPLMSYFPQVPMYPQAYGYPNIHVPYNPSGYVQPQSFHAPNVGFLPKQ